MSIKNEVNVYFIKGLFGWRSEKVGGQNMRKGQKSGRIEHEEVFGWENGKVERCKTMKNEVDINLQLRLY